MEIFAIICLVVIMVTIINLVNWAWRTIAQDDDGGTTMAVIITLIGGIAVVGCLKFITIWGAPLLGVC